MTEKPSLLLEWLSTGISNLTGKRRKKVKMSSAPDHLLHCNYPVNFDDFHSFAADSKKFYYFLGKGK